MGKDGETLPRGSRYVGESLDFLSRRVRLAQSGGSNAGARFRARASSEPHRHDVTRPCQGSRFLLLCALSFTLAGLAANQRSSPVGQSSVQGCPVACGLDGLQASHGLCRGSGVSCSAVSMDRFR